MTPREKANLCILAHDKLRQVFLYLDTDALQSLNIQGTMYLLDMLAIRELDNEKNDEKLVY